MLISIAGCTTLASTEKAVRAAVKGNCYSAAQIKVMTRAQKLNAVKDNELAGRRCN